MTIVGIIEYILRAQIAPGVSEGFVIGLVYAGSGLRAIWPTKHKESLTQLTFNWWQATDYTPKLHLHVDTITDVPLELNSKHGYISESLTQFTGKHNCINFTTKKPVQDRQRWYPPVTAFEMDQW